MADIIQSTNEAKLLTDERFLRKVAHAYYEESLSQETIAGMYYCSRQTVGKALQRAKERGIVRISIIPDLRTGYLSNLSREVRVELGLEDLILVAGNNMNSIPAEDTLEDVIFNISSAAAEYLDQMLGDSDILAVSGGRTFMRNLVRFSKPTKTLPHLQVVATIGFVENHTNYGDANLIAHDIAELYGANHMWFPCPAFFASESELQSVRKFPIVKDAYEMMARANIVVTGLWTPGTNEDLLRHGVITQKQLDAIAEHHPMADINHWIFDAAGRCINYLLDTPLYLSGLEIPRLRESIKTRNAKVVLVAGGSPSYIPAIRAVLKAGLANILVTDHVTAQFLLMDI